MNHTIAIAVAVFLAASSAAETITVCVSGCDYASINAAIAAASDGDVIQLAAETYLTTATLNCNDRELAFVGATDRDGSPSTILDGNNRRILEGYNAALSFENIEFRNSSTGITGGALMIQAGDRPLRVFNCRFWNNSAGNNGGGALAVYSSGLDISRCEFLQNRAYAGGAIWLSGSAGHISQCRFLGNTATSEAGAIFMGEARGVVVEDCEFYSNYGGSEAGAVSFRYTNTSGIPNEVRRCEFVQNRSYRGGAVFIRNQTQAAGAPVFDACVFYGNLALNNQTGGGTCFGTGAAAINACLGSVFALHGCIVAKNACQQVGSLEFGVIRMFSDCDAIVSDSRFCGNVQFDLEGPWTDAGENEFGGNCEICPADLSVDGFIDSADLGLLIAQWGERGVADLNQDGQVDAGDLGLLVAAWGKCQWW